MSSIPAFVLESARAGRWMRGLMALHGQTHSMDPSFRQAAVAVAQTAAPHHWQAALGVLLPIDAICSTAEVCSVLDTVSRAPGTPVKEWELCAENMLRALGSCRGMTSSMYLSHSPSDSAASIGRRQKEVFLGITQWCSWESALRLAKTLSTPDAACTKRVEQLWTLQQRVLYDVGCFNAWRMEFQESSLPAPPNTLASQVSNLSLQRWRYSPRDRRELNQLHNQKYRKKIYSVAAEEQEAIKEAMSSLTPPVWCAAAMLRCCTRSPAPLPFQTSAVVSFDEAISRLQNCRLPPSLALLYSRAVGLCAPNMWQTALQVLTCNAEVRDPFLQALMTYWMVSRGSWGGAIEWLENNVIMDKPGAPCSFSLRHRTTEETEQPQLLNSSSFFQDVLSCTLVPFSVFHRTFPQQSRPWYRLPTPTEKAVAKALAMGLRLDELQMSAVAKQWCSHGLWEQCLALYHRLPLIEFQKYAVRSLVSVRPPLPKMRTDHVTESAFFSSKGALYAIRGGDESSLHHPLPPLSTFATCALIKASSSWIEALFVFRHCVLHGTQCKPQILSALLDFSSLPAAEARKLLANYSGAVNDGIRRRARDEFDT